MTERDKFIFHIGRYFGFWAGLDSGWDAGYREGLRRAREIKFDVEASTAGANLAVVREHVTITELKRNLQFIEEGTWRLNS